MMVSNHTNDERQLKKTESMSSSFAKKHNTCDMDSKSHESLESNERTIPSR